MKTRRCILAGVLGVLAAAPGRVGARAAGFEHTSSIHFANDVGAEDVLGEWHATGGISSVADPWGAGPGHGEPGGPDGWNISDPTGGNAYAEFIASGRMLLGRWFYTGGIPPDIGPDGGTSGSAYSLNLYELRFDWYSTAGRVHGIYILGSDELPSTYGPLSPGSPAHEDYFHGGEVVFSAEDVVGSASDWDRRAFRVPVPGTYGAVVFDVEGWGWESMQLAVDNVRLGWVQYSPSGLLFSVRKHFNSPEQTWGPSEGDLNGDGKTDFEDLILFRNQYGNHPELPIGIPGDMNYDGAVNLDDLFVVRNFFTGGPFGTDLDLLFEVRNNFGTEVTPIPEPAAVSLLLAGAAGMLCKRSSRSR